MRVVDFPQFVARSLTQPSPNLVSGSYRVLPARTLPVPKDVAQARSGKILAEVQCESMLVWVTTAKLMIQAGDAIECGWWSDLEGFTGRPSQFAADGPANSLLTALWRRPRQLIDTGNS